MTDTATIAADARTIRHIVRTIAQAEDTISTNAQRIREDLVTIDSGIANGFRIGNIGGQRVTDLDRAVTARQAAWDMVAVLGLDEGDIQKMVSEY